jgi:hypothetical protein
MGQLYDRYLAGDCVQVWTELLMFGSSIRDDPSMAEEAMRITRETMRRARGNVERLREVLPAEGYRFSDPMSVLIPPEPDVGDELDDLERTIGAFPLSVRIWFEEVGSVSLAGEHPAWGYDYVDELIVETTIHYTRSEHEEWRAGERRGQDPFQIEFAPDYLHKANVSGGLPYGVEVPNRSADGLVLGEFHQTTFVNYLRIAFRWAGFPGWDRVDTLRAVAASPPPRVLKEIAGQLEPI